MTTSYDLKFRYNKKADAYVATVQKASRDQPALYEVTLAHGDRALPHGLVKKSQGDPTYRTFMFQPGHAADHDLAELVGTSSSLQEAIDDVRAAWEKGA